jgi:hypothetical protein
VTPNHSIERMSDRLRRPATAHVKRYAKSDRTVQVVYFQQRLGQ